MSEITDLMTSNNDLFIINCKDIFLREFREEDFEEYHALTWKSDVVEFLPDWFQNTLDIEHESYNYYQLSKQQWREKA